MRNQVIQGDALAVLKTLPTHSVDAVVSDPPAGIAFMGADWDASKGGRDRWIDWLANITSEALRVVKPGGHAVVWSLPRTSHWTALALEYGGWEIRDSIEHIYGEGMPKSHNISKAIDKMAGADRQVIGRYTRPDGSGARTCLQGFRKDYVLGEVGSLDGEALVTAPATPEAEQWAGFGTGLKPAHETWWLARSPIAEDSIAANVLEWGTGALNIDATRIAANDGYGPTVTQGASKIMEARPWNADGAYKDRPPFVSGSELGRWPSNLVLSHTLYCQPGACVPGCPVAELDQQSGYSRSRASDYNWSDSNNDNVTHTTRNIKSGVHFADQGGASRYFAQFYYSAKARKSERNAGCDRLQKKYTATMNDGIGGREHNPDQPGAWNGNNHPTVKPINLMRYLARLVTPPGGLVLDMFGGSGTTALACIAEGFDYLLIEQEAEYVEIARARIAHAMAEREAA